MQKLDNHSITKFLLLIDLLKSRGGRIRTFTCKRMWSNQIPSLKYALEYSRVHRDTQLHI
jgi:hypothetical protein